MYRRCSTRPASRPSTTPIADGARNQPSKSGAPCGSAKAMRLMQNSLTTPAATQLAIVEAPPRIRVSLPSATLFACATASATDPRTKAKRSVSRGGAVRCNTTTGTSSRGRKRGDCAKSSPVRRPTSSAPVRSRVARQTAASTDTRRASHLVERDATTLRHAHHQSARPPSPAGESARRCGPAIIPSVEIVTCTKFMSCGRSER